MTIEAATSKQALESIWPDRIQNAERKEYDQLLYDATGSGDNTAISTLLKLGAMIVPIGKKKDTALHHAAKNGLPEKLELLTQFSGSVDLKNKRGRTPLYYAAKKGNLQCLKILLNHPESPKKSLESILDAAIKSGNSKAVAMLLDHSIKIYGKERAKDKFCRNILTAVDCSSRNALREFRKRKFSMNGGYVNRLLYDEYQKHRITNEGKEYQHNPSRECSANEKVAFQEGPIISAVGKGDVRTFKWLERNGADMTILVDRGWCDNNGEPILLSLLEFAKHHEKTAIIEYLESKSA